MLFLVAFCSADEDTNPICTTNRHFCIMSRVGSITLDSKLNLNVSDMNRRVLEVI